MKEKIPLGESTPSLDENKSSPSSWYPVTTDSAMDEKVTSLEENDTWWLNESRLPTWCNIMYWILIMVEILFIISAFIFVPMLMDQHPPSDWWYDSRYLLLYADYGVPLAVWQIFILLDELYFSRLRRDNPACKGGRGARGFRRVADYWLLYLILILPKHGQGMCFQRQQIKG
jgi:hypothetical protein